MTFLYNKPIHSTDVMMPQIQIRQSMPVSYEQKFTISSSESDSFDITTQPLSATKEQIEGFVRNNTNLQRIIEKYNLCSYS